MRSATATERAAVKRRFTRVRLGQRVSHPGERSTSDVNVTIADRPYKALGAFLVGQHEVAALLAVRLDVLQTRFVWIGCKSQFLAPLLAKSQLLSIP